jgi:hypothetical protein
VKEILEGVDDRGMETLARLSANVSYLGVWMAYIHF